MSTEPRAAESEYLLLLSPVGVASRRSEDAARLTRVARLTGRKGRSGLWDGTGWDGLWGCTTRQGALSGDTEDRLSAIERCAPTMGHTRVRRSRRRKSRGRRADKRRALVGRLKNCCPTLLSYYKFKNSFTVWRLRISAANLQILHAMQILLSQKMHINPADVCLEVPMCVFD